MATRRNLKRDLFVSASFVTMHLRNVIFLGGGELTEFIEKAVKLLREENCFSKPSDTHVLQGKNKTSEFGHLTMLL